MKIGRLLSSLFFLVCFLWPLGLVSHQIRDIQQIPLHFEDPFPESVVEWAHNVCAHMLMDVQKFTAVESRDAQDFVRLGEKMIDYFFALDRLLDRFGPLHARGRLMVDDVEHLLTVLYFVETQLNDMVKAEMTNRVNCFALLKKRTTRRLEKFLG